MTTKRGSEITTGDTIVFLGKAHRISRIEDYRGALLESGILPKGTRIAYEDQGTGKPWGITLTPSTSVEVR